MDIRRQRCPRCEGTGRKNCPVCRGKGFIDEFNVWAKDVPVSEMTSLIEAATEYRRAIATGDVLRARKVRMQTIRDATTLDTESFDKLMEILHGLAKAVDGKTSSVTVNISGGNVGLLNTSSLQNVRTINTHLVVLTERGDEKISEAIRKLAQAAIESSDITAEQRTYVLDNLEEVGRQATLPVEARSKASVIKSLLNGLGGTLAAAGGTAEVWSTWGRQIFAFFGL